MHISNNWIVFYFSWTMSSQLDCSGIWIALYNWGTKIVTTKYIYGKKPGNRLIVTGTLSSKRKYTLIWHCSRVITGIKNRSNKRLEVLKSSWSYTKSKKWHSWCENPKWNTSNDNWKEYADNFYSTCHGNLKSKHSAHTHTNKNIKKQEIQQRGIQTKYEAYPGMACKVIMNSLHY